MKPARELILARPKLLAVWIRYLLTGQRMRIYILGEAPPTKYRVLTHPSQAHDLRGGA